MLQVPNCITTLPRSDAGNAGDVVIARVAGCGRRRRGDQPSADPLIQHGGQCVGGGVVGDGVGVEEDGEGSLDGVGPVAIALSIPG